MRRNFLQGRRFIVAATLVAITVIAVVASVVWTTERGSSDPIPSSELPAPTEPFSGYGGAFTDAGPNPWQMNDPEWAISFLERYCPASPPLTSDMGAEITEAVRDCIASRRAALGDFAAPSL